MAAKARKRQALSDLRDLADELGLDPSRKKADLSEADFLALYAEVQRACATSEQTKTAETALKRQRHLVKCFLVRRSPNPRTSLLLHFSTFARQRPGSLDSKL